MELLKTRTNSSSISKWAISPVIFFKLFLLVTFLFPPTPSLGLLNKWDEVEIWRSDNMQTVDYLFAGQNNEHNVFINSMTQYQHLIFTSSHDLIDPSDSCKMKVNADITNTVSCRNVGEINLNVAYGTYPLSYLWSNGRVAPKIIFLAGGEYIVTVTDANGCVSINSFIVAQPPPLVISLDSLVIPDSLGSGLIWITVTGGSPPYSYYWDGGYFDFFGGEDPFVEDANNLSKPDRYTVTVRDQEGCNIRLIVSAHETVSVSEINYLEPIKVYPVPAKEMLSIDLQQPVEEVLIYSAYGRLCKHIIHPGSNTLDISDLAPGWYNLRISDGTTWYGARIVK